MSNIDTRHNILPFTSGESKALSGQRLAKVGYKGKEALFPSVCASVPFISLADVEKHSKALIPHMKELLERTQNSIIRALYEKSGGQLTSVSDTDISLNACMAYLEAESSGGKLSGDQIKAWYKEVLETGVQLMVMEKLGITGENTEDITKVEQASRAVSGLLESFAAPSIVFSPVQRTHIRNILSIVSDDPIAERMIARLDIAEKKEKETGELLDIFS